MKTIALTLGDEEHSPGTSSDLRATVLEYLDGRRFAEVWLRSGDDFQINMLVNGSRAWLMYLVNLDEECWHTVDREYSGAKVEFTLANGQVDEYPSEWTIETTKALEGLEYFFDTCGRLASIEWERDF